MVAVKVLPTSGDETLGFPTAEKQRKQTKIKKLVHIFLVFGTIQRDPDPRTLPKQAAQALLRGTFYVSCIIYV